MTPPTVQEGMPRVDALIASLKAISSTDDPIQIGLNAGRGIRRFVPFDALVSISVRNMRPGEYKVTRRMIGLRSIRENLNPWQEWDRLETYRGGIVARALVEDHPCQFTNLFLRGDPALGDDLASFGSCLAIPLFDGGQALNWNFLFRLSRDGFTPVEIELITLVSNLLGQATRNMVTTRKVEQLNDRISTQLHEVALLQRSLLPSKLPDIPGLEMKVSYQPCELAGGDYYDFTKLPCCEQASCECEEPWGIIVADVAGHGARAAVVMAILQTLTENIPGSQMNSPESVLAYLNEQILRKNMERTFVTALCMGYDAPNHRLAIASAGHPPPRLKKPGKEAPVIPLESHSAYPLGIDRDLKAHSTYFDLDVGDTVVVFTDGVTESFNARHEMFGLERLDAAIRGCSGEPACIIDSVRTALAHHEMGRQPSDDQTILAFKVCS